MTTPAADAVDVVWVDVLPSLSKFVPALKATLGTAKGEAAAQGAAAGQAFGTSFATRAAATIDAAAQKVALAQKRAADATGQLAVAQQKLTAIQAEGDASATRLAAAQEAVAKAQRNVELQTGALTRAEQAQVRVEADVAAAAKVAATATEESAAKTDIATASTKNLTREMGFARGALGGVSSVFRSLSAVALGGAFYEAVKSAAQFNASMLTIQTQAGATSAELAYMKPRILALAGPTAQAPEALATSLYHVESTGIRSAKAIDVVTAAAKFATIAHANLEETTNALTATVISGIPGIHNMDQAIAMLNATVGVGDMRLSDLNQALGSGVLAVVTNYGLQMRDVSAALATFGDNNIRGAEAATALRLSVQAMAVPVKGGQKVLDDLGISSQQAASGLGKLGIKASGLATDMQQGGLNQALADLKKHLDDAGIKGNQVGEVLTAAFGKKAGPGLAVLVDQFDRLQSKYTAVDQASAGFNKEWEATQHTAQFAFDSLKSSMQALLIELGSDLLPALASIAGWLSKHVTLVKDVLIGFGILTAAVLTYKAGILAAAGAQAVWNAAMAIFDAEADANPIGLIVLALAGLVTAIIVAYNHSKAFRDIVDAVGAAFGRLFDAIKWAAEHIATMITNLAKAFDWLGGKIGGALAGAAQNIKNWAIGIIDKKFGKGVGESLFEDIKKGFQDLPHELELSKNALIKIWSRLWSDMKSAYETGTSGGKSLFASVKKDFGLLADTFDKVNHIMGKSFTDTFDGIHKSFTDSFDRIRQAWRTWIEPFFTLAGDLVVKVGTVIGRSWDDLKKKWSEVWGAISQLWSGPGGGAETHTKVQQAAHDTDFAEKSAWGEIQNVFGQSLAGLKRAWDATGAPLVEDMKTDWKDLSTGFATAAQSIAAGFSGLMQGVEDTLNTLIGAVNHTLIAGFNNLASAVGSSARLPDLPLLGVTLHNSGGNPVPIHGPFAGGGVIPGYAPGVDSVHALVSPGEGILVPEATRALGGVAGINAINATFSSRVRRFATGGVVGDVQAAMANPVAFFGGKLDAALGGLGSSPVAAILKAIPHELLPSLGKYLSGIVSAIESVAAVVSSALGFTAPPASRSANVATVNAVAALSGWNTGPEWNALVSVIMRESGFNNTAQNPTSTAYGMFQFLNSTWGSYGGFKTSDPTLQALDGLRYIKQRYVDPLGALAHENAFGWFDQGGLMPDGWFGGNASGGIERVLTPPQDHYFRDFVDATRSGASSDGGTHVDVGGIHMHSANPYEVADELVYRLRVAGRGGVYARGR